MMGPLHGQMAGMGMARGGALHWSLGGGAIPAANVVEAVELPTQGQLYAGGALATAWTVSIRTNLASAPTNQYTFDSQSGRVVLGIGAAGQNGFLESGSWKDVALFVTGDHTYMLVCTGTGVRVYRDNVAIGSSYANSPDIATADATRWRANYLNSGSFWAAELRSGHVANIALDATQRAGLHASMMALA